VDVEGAGDRGRTGIFASLVEGCCFVGHDRCSRLDPNLLFMPRRRRNTSVPMLMGWRSWTVKSLKARTTEEVRRRKDYIRAELVRRRFATLELIQLIELTHS
jgi:hypothetical protein